jgi:polyisoprenoid-binding protein YceI
VAQQGRVPRPAHNGHLGPRGFGEVQGKLELDFERWTDATFEGQIDASGIWTGQQQRDTHLRSADLFDVENHPRITFTGRFTEQTGATRFKGQAQLTIRGITRAVALDVR